MEGVSKNLQLCFKTTREDINHLQDFDTYYQAAPRKCCINQHFFPLVVDSTLLPTLDITILTDIFQFDRQKLTYHVAVIFKYLNTSEILCVFFQSVVKILCKLSIFCFTFLLE